MPLPPALAARLAKRGILSPENVNPSADEEVIAENYDKPSLDNHIDEFGNPLPPTWEKVWEPERDTWYYWDTITDKVSWLPPNDPDAIITYPAPKKSVKIIEEDSNVEKKAPPQAVTPHYHRGPTTYRKPNQERRKKPTKTKEKEFDPMDPSSYSDAPVGGWASGLKKIDDAKSGVDSTANGPLFQQRPYPSPGEVLSRNKQARGDYGPVKPK